MSWISVKDRLPDKNGEYLAVTPNMRRKVNVAYFEDCVWLPDERHFTTVKVTHWMPLPEPPEEERK